MKLKTAVFITALSFILPVAAFAAPTATLASGSTSVKLSSQFSAALTALGQATNSSATLGLTFPALNRRGEVRFPIVGGLIDAEDAGGEISHIGGLSITARSTRVDLGNFVIDTTSTPVLTGLVRVNDSIVGRLPLFRLGLPTLTLPLTNLKSLKLNGVSLSLTQEAAQALNGSFNVSLFSQGVPVGTARVSGTILRSSKK